MSERANLHGRYVRAVHIEFAMLWPGVRKWKLHGVRTDDCLSARPHLYKRYVRSLHGQ